MFAILCCSSLARMVRFTLAGTGPATAGSRKNIGSSSSLSVTTSSAMIIRADNGSVDGSGSTFSDR